jgi:hypothetical protein
MVVFEPDRLQPELRRLAVPSHVRVNRLAPIAREKEKPVRATAEIPKRLSASLLSRARRLQ